MAGAPATRLERFHVNVAPSRDRVRIHVGRSADILRRLPAGYDFAYIDGSHAAADVLSDAVMVWPLLNPGDLMLFDDYEWPLRDLPIERPKMAIDAFMARFEGRYEIVHRGFQVALRKPAG